MESNLKIINLIIRLFVLGLLFAWCFLLIRPFIVITLWGVVLAIALLGYSESLGAAKAAAEKTGEEIAPNQELVSHGPANLGSALSSGFVVVGSLSKTSVAMEAGAKTQLSSLVHGSLVVLTLLFLMPLFRNLPHATLAAIIIEAMLGLANFSYLKN